MIKKKFDLDEIKKILKKKGFIISRKKKINLPSINNDIKSLYFTFIASLVVISFFFFLPSLVDFQKNSILASVEIENKSKSNLEKVLRGIEKAKNVGLKIKINTVALKNFNEDHLIEMIDWCAINKHDMTIIEVMPMGDIGGENRYIQYLE